MRAFMEPARLEAASRRFVGFFSELQAAFVEREDVLMQIALALLCREHVLLTGPPGTAKSQIASAVLGRLIDEETGSPSLYARQFTESTVQTDLIGPINFKTLTETGRTEHFTDEGMLGAVHAFLDEVFDGRDMLLRATLNVLHEREIKQGTRITRGRFECALMASNRYIADILESSRDTLLAFVDRIAFVGFVPRGFAEPANLGAVLRRQVSGVGRAPLEAPLTIQDIDALQRAVESVYIAEPICDGLATLLAMFDAELNAAVRADPTFLPTRYVSTRTAVRSGQILRGICVYDKLFRNPDRPLEVMPQDLSMLRLHLLLTGPSADGVAKLLERETEARERRQLGILRTEREIFDRCWAKLPPITVPPRPPPPSPPPAKPAAGGVAQAGPEPVADAHAPASAPPPPPETPLERSVRDARKSRDMKQIVAVIHDVLVPASHGGGEEAERAQELLKESVADLHAQALRASLTPDGRGGTGRSSVAGPADLAADLAELAAMIEQASVTTRPLARWLRGRAIALVGDAAGYSLGVSAADLDAAASAGGGASVPMSRAEKRIEALKRLAALRERLLLQGAGVADRDASDAAWARGITGVEDDVAFLCDAAIRNAAEQNLTVGGSGELAAVLAAFAPDFERVGRLDKEFTSLKGAPSSLKARVLGPRVGLLVEAAFARLSAIDRASFAGEIEKILDVLERAGLTDVTAARDWVRWTASALLRSEPDAALEGDGGDASAALVEDLDYEGYRRLRAAQPRVSNGFVLADVALRVAPGLAAEAEGPAGALTSLASLLAGIPEPERARTVALDLARIDRALTHLSRWFRDLAHPEPEPADEARAAWSEERLREIVLSRFFDVLLNEEALARFVLEARLLSDLFPDHEPQATAIRARIDDLQEQVRSRVHELVKSRGDAAWAATVRAS